jgi:L-aspartate oxidase
VETANLALAGSALLAAAELRSESRGCHVRNDHPDRSPVWERSVLVRVVDGLIRSDVADLRTAVAWA